MIVFRLTPSFAISCAVLALLLAGICVLHIADYASPGKLDGWLLRLARWRLPAWMRPVTAIACVPLGLFLIEFPYSFGTAYLDPAFIWTNLMLVGMVFGSWYFLCQQSRTSMVVFLGACAALGIASYFVAQFKGQAIMPSDVASLRTAEAVMGGYTYAIDNAIAGSFAIVVAFACVCTLLPKKPVRRMETAIANVLCLALFGCFATCWWLETDIEKDYEANVHAWNTLGSYQTQGFALSFLECVQQLSPVAPEGYSSESAASILASMPSREGMSGSTLTSASYVIEPDEQPSIVVIMNESFADYSMYDIVDEAYSGPTRFKEIAADSLVHGDAYVSAMSGGTCNSEFEFLTGSTMGMLGTGVYPYTFYDLSNVVSVVRNVEAHGYQTIAIHPESAYNWRRDRVYEQLDFDRFLSSADFNGAETRRNYITDAETYDLVLELLESSDQPQFIFDVTVANHGGYESGMIPEDSRVSALVDGVEDEALNEYLSCIAYSDMEFAEFIEEIGSLNRPVIVCMFGDHQPSFADELASKSLNMSVDEMEIAQRQLRYTTPYLIWTNNGNIRRAMGVGREMNMSLNYLGATVMSTAGIALDDYFSFLLAIRPSLPAINLNGFMDEDNVWRWFVEDGPEATKLAREQLRIMQYDNLFG